MELPWQGEKTMFMSLWNLRNQNILNVFLEECGESYLFNCLSYCLFELLDNASKANAKTYIF